MSGERIEVLIEAAPLRERIAELGRQIAADSAGRPLTLVVVLDGAFIFAADLVRRLSPLAVQVCFVRARSYRGQTPGPLETDVDGLDASRIAGRDVLIVDDILDTGRTLEHIRQAVAALHPRSLAVCVLLRKPTDRHGRLAVDCAYVGFDIPAVFAVGYGLDCDGAHRHLPYVGHLSAGPV
jgi:hypoxanthine phosphoribosyltransferase